MPLIKSCCCWRSLRRGCYASGTYTMLYFAVTIITMGHFIEVEHRYLSGQMSQPESESFLQPDKITPITVSLNITLLACSTLGLISCILMIVGVYTDKKFLLLPWIVSMALETLVEVINLGYLFYLQTFNFNPITAFLFTLDFFIIVLNVYTMFCVISQFQEYLAGRGTAAFDTNDRLASVQYTATAQHTTTTSSAPSGRRRSAGRPAPSRCDLEEHSEVQAKNASTFPKTSRSHVKKHVQFPDANSCIEEATEAPPTVEEKPEARVISSLWMELESETPAPER
ncbi:PREDICTED: uncharacterized protein LOC106109494 isoform X1 [Papilio polytes]|uniref:uncharacterized protein LOC106109494 isoform X1 n=1 Tax=Papilio polytes TaxID=76194 RepID=UPI000675CB66|nr:PREDICTED: uncharacterized protein LOC106109494 isoform X1 [Papilio polytes]